MITGSHRFPTMEEVIYGQLAADAVAALADAFGARRLLLVTTRSLDTRDGEVAALRAALGVRCVGIFSAIRAHSPREDVVACADAARAADADLLVALGGGSVIDAVKVVQLCLWGDVRAAEGVGQLVRPRRARAQARRAHDRAADHALGRRVHAVRRRHRYAPARQGGLRPPDARRRARSCSTRG